MQESLRLHEARSPYLQIVLGAPLRILENEFLLSNSIKFENRFGKEMRRDERAALDWVCRW